MNRDGTTGRKPRNEEVGNLALISSSPSLCGWRSRDAVGILARLILGGLFLYAGLVKALDPVTFLKLVRQYELTDTYFLLNAMGAVLPWFEALCGALLVGGVAVRGSSLILLVLLVPFTWAVLHRALTIQAAQGIPFTAIKFDCGCGTGEVFAWRKLIENSVLILLSVGLVCGYGRRLCARYRLF